MSIGVILGGSSAASATSTAWPGSVSNSQIFPGGLWTNPSTLASSAAAKLGASGRTADAALVRQISSQPSATWLGDWWSPSLLTSKLRGILAASAASGSTPVFVTYAIPNRDCGGYSAGGYTESEYLAWNRTIASTLLGSPAVVLMEPDSIAMLGEARCAAVAGARLQLLAQVAKIYFDVGVPVYLDGGNSRWVAPGIMATRLSTAGVQYARGFFTNVANFSRVDAERSYADSLSALLGGSHFVIDVSRNGSGWQGSWCNPPGAALGQNPHVTAGTTGLDALLWVKNPGVSDGSCNGSPAAGAWFEASALLLVANRAAR
ncbi:MAG: glycoside hydrolase family 6 protein [Actinomycetota bacterium]